MYTKIDKIIDYLYDIRNHSSLIKYKKRNGKFLVKSLTNNSIIHVIANGPSYLESEKYIDELPGDSMCMNFALNKELVLKHLPKYICWCDPDFFKASYESKWDEILEYCKKNKACFLVPFLYSFGTKLQNSPYVIELNSITRKGEIYTPKMKIKYEKNEEVPAFQTVAIMAIYVAIQLGYKRIYLHGVDEDQLKRLELYKGQLYTEYYHFYEEKKKEKMSYGMFDMVKSYMTLLEGFKKLADYARDENVQIINMNPNSNIEFFDFY